MSLTVFSRIASQLGKSVTNGIKFQTQARLFSFQSALFARKYTDKHEWVDVNGKIGTVGITDYAQDKLGEVVYAELPEVGTELEQSVQFATLESVKAVSECYTPVAGKVLEINQSIEENPSQINNKPFDEGWLIKLELTNESQLEALMDEAQYKEYLKSEDH